MPSAYKPMGDTLGGNFLVNDDGGSYDQYDPSVAASDSGFVISWYDYPQRQQLGHLCPAL